MKILLDCPVCGKHNVELNLSAGLSALDAIEKRMVEEALKLTRGNQTAAGRELGIAKHQIRYLIEKHDLKSETFS